jgi:hypothetical protein
VLRAYESAWRWNRLQLRSFCFRASMPFIDYYIQAPRLSTLAASMTARVQTVFQNPSRQLKSVSVIITRKTTQPLAALEPHPSTHCDREQLQ